MLLIVIEHCACVLF